MTDKPLDLQLEEETQKVLGESFGVRKLAVNSTIEPLRKYQLALDYKRRETQINWLISGILLAFFALVLIGIAIAWTGFVNLDNHFGVTPGNSRAGMELLLGMIFIFLGSGVCWWLQVFASHASARRMVIKALFEETQKPKAPEPAEEPNQTPVAEPSKE